jgi:hypothetical protein
MSDRKKQELRGLSSIYTVNMAGYKSAPVTSSESSSIYIMLSFLLYSEMSKIRCAVSERVNVHFHVHPK